MDERTLSPQEKAFCVAYASIGSETYSNGKASALAAKYSEKSAHSCAWRLLQRPHIRGRIEEIQKDAMNRNYMTTDKVLADLEHARREALRTGKLAEAIRASEFQGKFLSMFSDRSIYVSEREESRELTEQEQEQAKRIAEIMVKENMEG